MTDSEPKHNVTLPFTRMFLGPDGLHARRDAQCHQMTFSPIFHQPMGLGTRCHQLAMYVVYESPLQMLADSPSNYLREPEAMEFLSPIPSVWDDTKALDGKIAEYVVVARRSGNDWYVGAMNNWTAREVELDLSFLPAGDFSMASYEDGPNADRMAGDYRLTKTKVSKSTKLKIKLAPGGGWAAHIQQ